MRVLLADDHPLFLDGLKNLMRLEGLEIVGTAGDGQEALEKARAMKPDVILMDVQMPTMDGLEATRLIKAEMPEVKIVMLTMSEDDDDLFKAIKNGACGYLLKTDATEKFFEMLSGLMQGEVPLSPGLSSRILKEFARQGRSSLSAKEAAMRDEGLTPRQLEVLTLVAQGLTYKEIGTKLFLSERTIKYHMGEIIDRLHLENRRQAIEYARRMNLTRP